MSCHSLASFLTPNNFFNIPCKRLNLNRLGSSTDRHSSIPSHRCISLANIMGNSYRGVCWKLTEYPPLSGF